MSDLVMMTVIYLAEGLCVSVLFQALAVPRSAYFRLHRYTAGVFWLIFWTVCNLALYLIFDADSGAIILLKFVLLTAVFLTAAALFFQGSFLQRLFPAVLLTAVRELALQGTNCLTFVISFATELLANFALDGKVSLEFFVFACQAMSFLMNMVIGLVRVAVIYRIVKTIANSYRYKVQFEKEALIYLLPSLVGIMVSVLLRILLLMIENGIPVLLYSRYPALYAVVPIISAALLASIVYGFRFYQNMIGFRQERTEKLLLQTQIAQLQQSIGETERLHESDRAFRHDLKNNLFVLQELLREKCPNDGEINRYFENLRLSSEETERRVKTGNAVSDAVVNGKFALAERELPGIRLDADGFLLNDLGGIEAYDVGIILSNALDNAIEACRTLQEKCSEEKLFISVRSLRKKNMLLLEVENSFGGVLRLGEDGFPQTTKADGASHGIGLRSIRNCAEKYSGGVDFTAENGRFVLSVMLKIALPRHEHGAQAAGE